MIMSFSQSSFRFPCLVFFWCFFACFTFYIASFKSNHLSYSYAKIVTGTETNITIAIHGVGFVKKQNSTCTHIPMDIS